MAETKVAQWENVLAALWVASTAEQRAATLAAQTGLKWADWWAASKDAKLAAEKDERLAAE
jgi:hypothetical protein